MVKKSLCEKQTLLPLQHNKEIKGYVIKIFFSILMYLSQYASHLYIKLFATLRTDLFKSPSEKDTSPVKSKSEKGLVREAR